MTESQGAGRIRFISRVPDRGDEDFDDNFFKRSSNVQRRLWTIIPFISLVSLCIIYITFLGFSSCPPLPSHSIMTYHNSSPILPIYPQNKDSYNQHILDVEKAWTRISGNDPVEDFSQATEYKSGMFGDTRRPHNNYFHPVDNDTSKLPRLAWITSVIGNSYSDYAYAISSINCYCASRGIHFFIEPEQLLPDGRSFYQSRWRNAQKYLPHFQWIMHSDSDMLVANFSKNLLDYLDDRYDVVMFTRENEEIHAGLVFVRNSEGGRDFLERWLNQSDDQTSHVRFNADNGDVQELLLSYISDEEVKKSIELRNMNVGNYEWYRYTYIANLHKVIAQFEGDSSTSRTYVFANKILIYRDRAGLIRSFDGHRLTEELLKSPPQLLTRLIPTDFIIHGKKFYRLIKKELVLCLNDKGPLQSIPEVWMSMEKAKELMIKEKVWSWSGCFENGINICKRDSQLMKDLGK